MKTFGTQRREVLGKFLPSDVLPYIGSFKKIYTAGGKEWPVNMGSLRYQTFARSLQCSVCGLTGSVMVLERDHGKSCMPHFNLYAIEGEDMVLMTKDHILPRAKGGKDHLDNMQTMCAICNGLKQDREITIEQIRLLRNFYNTFRHNLSLAQIMKAIQCIFDFVELGGITSPLVSVQESSLAESSPAS